MSEIKGYVVRGQTEDGEAMCVRAHDRNGTWWSHIPTDAEMMTLAEAGAVWPAAHEPGWNVRVYAVAEDGTEAPLPTYAAALDEVGQLCAEVNLARGRTMAALAEAERLRGEVDTMRGQRDAFRDHLDLAYRNAYTERAAWARLVRAEQAHHDQTDLLGERDDDAKGAYAEVVAARQALCDLGVDVGSQLGEGPAS